MGTIFTDNFSWDRNGAAIIKKDDYSLVVAGSNNETENPLWHGEINTLKKNSFGNLI